jgi:hypothetical protein
MDPPGSDPVVTFSCGALTAMLRLALPVACVGVYESVTVTLKAVDPV